jgi:hypothetical protein
MKKIIFLLFFCWAFTLQAQYGNRERTRQIQRENNQNQRKPPKPNFEVKKYLGIIVYDISKAAKKSGIKLSTKEGKQFSKIITDYTKSTQEIARINTFVIRSTKEMVENFQEKAMKSGDLSNQPKVYKKMVENLKPISEIIKKEDKELNKKIKALLSKKQYKKWIKYNKKLNKVFTEE